MKSFLVGHAIVYLKAYAYIFVFLSRIMAGPWTFNVISFIYLERGETPVTGDMHAYSAEKKIIVTCR